MTTSSGVLAFPNPVNENAARVVSAGVAVMAIAALLSGWHVIIAVMALGFLARVLTGPRLSVLGQFATRVAAPRLGPPRFVPGPPKRFAQGVGFVLTTVAAVSSLAFGERMLAVSLMAVILVFALMESVIGLCAACVVFGFMLRRGWLPEETCEACQQVWRRYGDQAATASPAIKAIRHRSVVGRPD